MSPRGLARRYATALFKAALKKDIAERIQEDIRSFQNLIAYDASLRSFLLSPQILTDEKKRLIKRILESHVDPLFIHFLLLLVDKKRFEYVEDIAEAYIRIYEQHYGIAEAKVITAGPLSKSQERKLLETLERQTQKQVRLAKITDSRIIAGMIIILEDKIIDGSVKFQLETLRKTLKEVKVY